MELIGKANLQALGLFQKTRRAVCHDILDFSARVLAILVHARPGLGDLSLGFSGSPVF